MYEMFLYYNIVIYYLCPIYMTVFSVRVLQDKFPFWDNTFFREIYICTQQGCIELIKKGQQRHV